MKNWPILAIAIVLEVTATLALRAAIEQPWWAIVTVVGYAGSFTLTIGVGIAVVIAGVLLVEDTDSDTKHDPH